MTWTPIAKRPSKHARHGSIVVHGDRIVWLWYGANGECGTYDPVKDCWATLASFDEYRRDRALVASAGSTLVVFSGERVRSSFGASDPAGSGGYRLDGATWRSVATKHQPSARTSACHAWTGDELLVWGGRKGSKPIANGAAYNPITDTWRKLTKTNAPPGGWFRQVWTGHEMWLFGKEGSFAYAPTADRWRTIAAPKYSPTHDAFSRLGDGALYVHRDAVLGTDVDTMSAWTYDAAGDRWDACAKPPEIRGAIPVLVECGERVVLALHEKIFEYLPAHSGWGELPAVPDKDLFEAEYVWVAGALYCFATRGDGCWRLELPAAQPEITAAPEALAEAPKLNLPRGPAVTAVAIADDGAVLAGHLDGSVRLGGKLVREPDDERIWGLAHHGTHWSCLAGDAIEIRAGAGKPTRVKVPFEAHALAHRGDTLAVGGAGDLAVYTWKSSTWTLVKQTTASNLLEVALSGDGGTLATVGIDAKNDVIELLATSSLSLLGSIKSGYERGTSSAIPMSASTAIVAGGGSYSIERWRLGKKRASTKFKSQCAWSSPIVSSADGKWLVSRDAGDGVELHDLELDRTELLFSPFAEFRDDDGLDSGALAPLVPPHPPKLFKPKRWGGSVSALAIDDKGTTLAVGTVAGVTYVIDRERLGIEAIAHDGTRHEIQAPLAERSTAPNLHAAGAEAARGVVTVVDGDGRIGELDVSTGAWTWGGTIAVNALAPLREHELGLLSARRRGDFVTVSNAQSNVFNWSTGAPIPPKDRRPDPDCRGLWMIADRHLIELDAITLVERGRTELPGRPSRYNVLVWLGGKRWLVDVDPEGSELGGASHVVDAATGEVTPVPFRAACATLDDRHFCVPESGSRVSWARRWKIYGDDLTTPVRSLNSHVHLAALAVLPGTGTLLGWGANMLVFLDADGTPRATFRGMTSINVCPSRDGKYVATWTRDGIFRRWPVPD